MRILLALALFSMLSIGASSNNPFVYRINTVSGALANTFLSVPQIGGTVSGPLGKIASIDVINTSTSEIEVNCSQPNQPPSVYNVTAYNSIAVPGSTGYSSPVNALVPFPFVNVCWIRSVGNAINSGIITVIAWGN